MVENLSGKGSSKPLGAHDGHVNPIYRVRTAVQMIPRNPPHRLPRSSAAMILSDQASTPMVMQSSMAKQMDLQRLPEAQKTQRLTIVAISNLEEPAASLQ